MRHLLDQLRDDLGIPKEDRPGTDDVGMGSNRPAVRSKTRTTGFTGEPQQFKTASTDAYKDGLGTLTRISESLFPSPLMSLITSYSSYPFSEFVTAL